MSKVDQSVVLELYDLYHAARTTSSYQGPTVEGELERRFATAHERGLYRDAVIDHVRYGNNEGSATCRYCGDQFPSKTARVSHEVIAHREERAADIDTDAILADYEAGMLMRDIEIKHGISMSMVWRYRKEAGLDLRQPTAQEMTG